MNTVFKKIIYIALFGLYAHTAHGMQPLTTISERLSDDQIGHTIASAIKGAARGIIFLPKNIIWGAARAIGKTIGLCSKVAKTTYRGGNLLASAATRLVKSNPKTSVAIGALGAYLFARSNFAKACGRGFMRGFLQGLLCHNDIRVIDFALRHGAPINHRYADGKNVLHIACENGYSGAVISHLIRCGAAMGFDTQGFSPIHYAAATGNTEAAEQLLRAGTDINIQSQFGDRNTPLHLAVRNNQLPMARWLIQHGAPIQQQNTHHEAPAAYIGIAWARGNHWNDAYEVEDMRHLFNHFVPYPADRHPDVQEEARRLTTTQLDQAIAQENPLRAQAAINGGAFLNATAHRQAPLFSTIRDYVAQAPTPLDTIAKALVRAGTPMNITDARGRMPLHYAAEHGNLWLARLFLQHGASAHAQDRTEHHATPMDIALRIQSRPMVDLLQTYGVNLTAEQLAANDWYRQQLVPLDPAPVANAGAHVAQPAAR